MAALAGANLALKFLLELGALALFATWGFSAAHGWSGVLLGLGAVAGMVVLWGLYAAPRADHRLRMPTRAVFELGIFGLAAIGGFASGHAVVAATYAVLVVVNAVLLTLLDQWEA